MFRPTCKFNRAGLTLTELLVVTAIIATLSMLILPAVQEAREAARRSSCQNNLKQIGLAILNYEAVHTMLPVGATHNLTFGVSWWVGTAKFLEEASTLDRFDTSGPHSGFALVHQHNGRLVDGLVIPSMICPSSPLTSLLTVGSFRVMMPSYVGINGASSHDGFQETRINTCCVPRSDGEISAGGMLVPNKAISIREITDGLSNTLMVGESSDFAQNENGTLYRVDGGHRPGWIMGTSVRGTPPDYGAPYPAWNITAIRYPPNMRSYGMPGIDQDRGANNPLLSAHRNGVNVCRGDGSVHFVSDDVDIAVLKRFATRDDDQALSVNGPP